MAEIGHGFSTGSSPSLKIFPNPAFVQICSALESHWNPPNPPHPAQRRWLNAKGPEPGKLCERQPCSCQEWDAISYPYPRSGPPTSCHSHSPSTPSPMGHGFLPEKAIQCCSLRIFPPDLLPECWGRTLALLRKAALAQHFPCQTSPRC